VSGNLIQLAIFSSKGALSAAGVEKVELELVARDVVRALIRCSIFSRIGPLSESAVEKIA